VSRQPGEVIGSEPSGNRGLGARSLGEGIGQPLFVARSRPDWGNLAANETFNAARVPIVESCSTTRPKLAFFSRFAVKSIPEKEKNAPAGRLAFVIVSPGM
jgi:hypothetical protein